MSNLLEVAVKQFGDRSSTGDTASTSIVVPVTAAGENIRYRLSRGFGRLRLLVATEARA